MQTRRSFVRNAVAASPFLACSALADRSAQAATPRITPPTVDKLTMQVVLDGQHDIFISGASAKDVGVERVRAPASFKGRTLQSEWGLSLHLVSSIGKQTKRMLLDFGFTPDVMNTNLDLLKIDMAAIDALILSHGHLDHMGGMLGTLKTHRAKMKQDLKLYVGGEDAFCHRVQKQDDGSFADYGVVDRAACLTTRRADRKGSRHRL